MNRAGGRSVLGSGAAFVAAIAVAVLGTARPVRAAGPQAAPPAAASGRAVVFDPPRPEDAPADIRDAVELGYQALMDTQRVAKAYVGNKLDCRNCHFDAGRQRHTLSLVGVAAKYPTYRKREGYSVDLVTRINDCFERSMNGRAVPPDSRLMTAIVTYFHWISRGIPIYAQVPWLGLKKIHSDHVPDATKGREVFAAQCTPCHGTDGQGTAAAPPLWGPGSFNDGAGMARLETLAAFARHFMPRGHPDLTDAEALDVAAFVTSQPRPHFHAKNHSDDRL